VNTGQAHDELTAPSSRHPQGLPRCRARCRRGGHQCPRPARAGFPVCWVHGAGSAKRERAGRRQNPRLAPLRHRFRARAESRELLRREEPSLEAAYRVRLQASGYEALRHELALLEALVHRFLAQNDMSGPDALAVAIDATAQIAALKERQARLERQLTPVSPDHLQRFLRGVDRAVARFVAADRRSAFFEAIRDALPPLPDPDAR